MSAAGDQPWIEIMTGDADIAGLFGETAQFASYARFESALLFGLATAGRIGADDARRLTDQIAVFSPDRASIAAGAARDGVPVPAYVRLLRAHVSGPGSELVHFGATSQDLIDTAMVEALLHTGDRLASGLNELLRHLDAIIRRDGDNALQAVTRMQPALTFRTAERLENWRRPLWAAQERWRELRGQIGVLQFGGAVGDLQALGAERAIIAHAVAEQLGLRWPGHAWHTERARFVTAAAWCEEISAALGKIGQDITLMALRGPSDITLSGGGASSAMPHKQNPVLGERLVALARFNATLMGGMHQARIHEMERSGAAWMLEWMTLPKICVTAGAALAAATNLIRSIERMGNPS